jgi:hypothetical protein
MSVGITAFIIGPLGAVPAGVLALAVATSTRRPRWAIRTTAILMGTTALAWLTFWALWYRSFFYLDDRQHVPAAMNAAYSIANACCAVGAVSLVTIAAVTLVLSRRPQTRAI